MGFTLGPRSLANLAGVHPDLIKVVERAIAITVIDFTVIDGMRSRAEAEANLASGASTTKRSRHLTGHAVDIAPYVKGKITFEWKYVPRIAVAMKQAAHELGIPLEWGGDWKSFKDGVHFQLPWKEYPA